MAQLTKTQAANDVMPKTIVKIIGSKYVRYVIENPKVSPVTIEKREDIMSQIMESCSGLQDLEMFKQSFLNADHSRTGLLLPSEFQVVCDSNGASISLQLLKAILDHNKFSEGGKIRWKIFVDLLHKMRNEAKSLQCEATGEHTEDSAVISNNSNNPAQEDNPDPNDDTFPECFSYTLAKKQNQPEQKYRPMSEPALLLSERINREAQETWIDRFQKLENVLHMCDTEHTGMVQKEKAKKLIHNCNFIYNLSLSPLKIAEALQQSSSGHYIELRKVLLYLKEL